MKIIIRANENKDRIVAAREIDDLMQENKVFPKLWPDPNIYRRENIVLKPNLQRWEVLSKQGVRLLPQDISDISRVATVGRRVGDLSIDGRPVPIVLHFPEQRVGSLEDFASFPLGVGGKLIPLKALSALSAEEMTPAIYREDMHGVVALYGKTDRGEENQAPGLLAKAEKLVNEWKQKKSPASQAVSVAFDDPQRDFTSALKQLSQAVGISILLIFLTMVLQFGSFMNSLIVLVAIPLGFIGVLLSLFIFKSSLSLNSVLGVILLNGIAVANSIILVDFMRKLVDRGLRPKEAALEAAQKRLRPILMTSLTTGLGMFPVAVGLGEGGRILQPLGIAVVGGLGFSVLFTLFIVPSLQVSFLEWKTRSIQIPSVEPSLAPAGSSDL